MSSRPWLKALSLIIAFGAAAAVDAATVLSKRVAIEILAGDRVRERTEIRVRLETVSDLESWSHYSVFLDSNRHLRSFEAWVIALDGRRRKAGRKRQDRMEYSGGATASSRSFHVVEFPGLTVGTVLEVAHEVEIEPYYRSSQMALLGDDPISDLVVEIRGGVRWRLDGPRQGLKIESRSGGVLVHGRDLEVAESPALAAGGAASEPVLRWAWAEDAGWSEVGDWYAELLAGLRQSTPEVRRLAAELTVDSRNPRQSLEALVHHLRRKVRYVAVEVGIGGYRPSPPRDVLERKWGDCKDKGLLLVSLLQEAGIEAYPALILFAGDRRIEPEFPSPAQFNHLIVAVPEGEVATDDDDPVGGGYLFIDPTQTRGTVGWLHPGVQDQDALVVTGGGGALVRTPVRPRYEAKELTADLTISQDGRGVGRASVVLRGTFGALFIDQMESAPPQRTGEDVVAIFKGLLPGAELGDVRWQEISGRVPAVRMSAALEVDDFVQNAGPQASLRLAGLRVTPEPRLLDEVDSAVAYSARVGRTRWRLKLPVDWCLPRADETRVINGAGSFLQTIGTDSEGAVIVERRSELAGRWFEPEDLDALRELAVSEHRALRRRIRLSCAE